MSGVSKATTSVPDFQGRKVTSQWSLNPKAAQSFLLEITPQTTGARGSAHEKIH